MYIDTIITGRAEEVSRFIERRKLDLSPKQINRIIKKATQDLIKIKQKQHSRLKK